MEDRPSDVLLVGATAAQPQHAVLIWNAIRRYFNENGMPVEYALYSTYEAMCSALLRDELDIAWNAPMAHAQSLLRSGGACRTLAMRDTDQDVTTVIVARPDAGIASVDDLRGRRVALGVPISAELRLVPAEELARAGLDVDADCTLVDLEPREYPNGEQWIDDRLIFDAVIDGTADAGAIFEPWLAPLMRKRGLDSDEIVVVWRSEPFCHCAFTARPGLPRAVGDRFVELLVAMDSSDPRIAEMMKLEYLERWLPADDEGWSGLMGAVERTGLTGKTF